MSRAAPEVVVVADEAALARAVAGRFIAAAREAIAARGTFVVALAGGSTPKAAYALLAGEAGAFDWNAVRFFFGDERCVPPGDDSSNFKMASETMLVPLGIPAVNIFRMRGEDDPQAGAAAYRSVLRTQLGDAPVFDYVMLGLGPDGHTASLVPGTDPRDGDELLVKSTAAPYNGTYRLTLTPRAINAARRVEIATAGEAKAQALAAALEGAYDPVRLPVQIVAPLAGGPTWLVDRAAAENLRGTARLH